jgi:hypothetical protein
VPVTAIWVIENVLQYWIEKSVLAYLDDISIYSDILVDHLAHIQVVCQCLQKYKIIASPKKCNFFTKITKGTTVPKWSYYSPCTVPTTTCHCHSTTDRSHI